MKAFLFLSQLFAVAALAQAVPTHFRGHFTSDGVRHDGDVTVALVAARMCRESYRGAIVTDEGEAYPVFGFYQECGWVGPYPVESLHVELPGGARAPLARD